jgi:CubicO group peptidase (beta-lactamase class C family)
MFKVALFAVFVALASAFGDDDDDSSSRSSSSSDAYQEAIRAPVFWRDDADGTIEAALKSGDFAPVTASFDAKVTAAAVLLIGDATGQRLTHSNGRDFTETSSTLIASASKLLSATAFVRLIQDGRIRLNSTLAEHVSWWTKDAADPRSLVTLEHCLAFTTGFNSSTIPCITEFNNKIAATTEECAKQLFESKKTFVHGPPGSQFNYDSSHMLLAALLAEKVLNKDWNAIFRDTVLQPLGIAAGAIAYELWTPTRPMLAGGVRTTAATYSIVLRAVFSNDSFITPASRAWFFADHTPNASIAYSPEPSWHYALGCWVECGVGNSAWQESCESRGIYSSLGAFGFYPVVRFDAARQPVYWAVVGQNVVESLLTAGIIVAIAFGVICALCCVVVLVVVMIFKKKRRG